MTLFRASAINGGSQSLGIPLLGIGKRYTTFHILGIDPGGTVISSYYLCMSMTVQSKNVDMMTSSNENIFPVTGLLCGPGEFPAQRPVTQSFDVFFDLRLIKRLSKQPWGWWFETPSWSLWRQCNRNYFQRSIHVIKHINAASPFTVLFPLREHDIISDVTINAMAFQITGITTLCLTICSGALHRKQQTPPHWPLLGEAIGDRWIQKKTQDIRGHLSMYTVKSLILVAP